MPAKLQLNDFTLERSILEVRYPEAFTLWDSAGTTWNAVLREFPNLSLVKAEPGATTFREGNRFLLRVDLELCSVIYHKPDSSLKEFADLSTMFYANVVKHLEITTMTRVATRLIYFKAYPGKEEASAAVLESPLMRVPTLASKARRPLFPEYVVRLEGDAVGVTYRVKAEGRQTEFTPPVGVDNIPTVHEEVFGVVFDVDYFSTTNMTPGQLDVASWIEEARREVKRTASGFLEGD